MVDALSHLKKKKNLNFNVEEYNEIIMENRERIAEKIKVYVN